jgi:SAM-dependent methyltransferase
MWSETIAYRAYLPPYLPAFFSDAAKRIPLRGGEALLDLGCGPGDVALGFAPHVASLTGVDLEQPMLDLARERAAEIGRSIDTIHAKAQEAPETIGPFDLITIGTAHWFMHSPATLARIGRWLRPGGSVLVCMPVNTNIAHAKWFDIFMDVRYRWSKATEIYDQMRLQTKDFFAGTDFALVDKIDTFGQIPIDLDHLLNRALAFPTTSRAILGDDAERMLAELRDKLAPHFANGPVTEWHCTSGWLFRRRGEAHGRAGA